MSLSVFLCLSVSLTGLQERIITLEETNARIEKILPLEEVAPEFSICAANLPRDAGKPDGTLAGELVTTLDIGLSHVNVAKVQRVGETKNEDGSLKYPGRLLIELDNKNNKIKCLGYAANDNIKRTERFKNVQLTQALSRAQLTERHNLKGLMYAVNMTDHRINSMGRIVPRHGPNYEHRPAHGDGCDLGRGDGRDLGRGDGRDLGRDESRDVQRGVGRGRGRGRGRDYSEDGRTHGMSRGNRGRDDRRHN